MKPGRILLVGAAVALVTGLVEQLPLFLNPRVGVMVRLGEEFVWMTPLADLLLFGTAGLLLIALGTRWPAAASRSAAVGTYAGLVVAALMPEQIHPVAVLVLAIGVGVQAGRMARGEPKRPRLVPIVAALAAFAVLGLTTRSAMGRQAWRNYWLGWLPQASAEAPNVLLLILDTVRASSLDLTGDGPDGSSDFPPVEAPEMEALARRATVFTRAIAPSPWTLPSHASMFTGRWPTELWDPSRPGSEWFMALDPRFPTVAEALSRSGYLTAGFIGNLAYATAETGLVRGFLTYEDYPVSLGQIVLSSGLGRRIVGYGALRGLLGWHELVNRKHAADVADAFLDWQRGQGGNGGRPFFAFLNFFDAHEPYFPPDSVKRAMPAGSDWEEFDHYAGVLTGTGASRAEKWTMDPAERAAHAAGYDAAVVEIDRQIGRILDVLEDRGVLDNTVVMVVSDHGEQLGEHGLYNHDNSLYLQNLHVPLIVYDPRRSGPAEVVTDVVTLRDVGATLLDLAGVDVASSGVGGTSLGRYLGRSEAASPDGGAAGPVGESAEPGVPVLSSLTRGAENEAWYPVTWGPAMYSLVDERWHYVRNGDGTEELYDVLEDPAELRNLAYVAAGAETLARMRARLSEMVPTAPAPAAAPLDHPEVPASGS